jgi:hypothetical protein
MWSPHGGGQVKHLPFERRAPINGCKCSKDLMDVKIFLKKLRLRCMDVCLFVCSFVFESKSQLNLGKFGNMI